MNTTLAAILENATPGILVAALLLAVLPWIPRQSKWRALPIGLVLVLILHYLYWRATETLPPRAETENFIAGVVFFAIELAAVGGSVISYVTLARTKNRTREADENAGWLASRQTTPLVDVFICTYNEDRDILERTMLGALGMHYSNHRVWVLDDGRRPWLEALAAELGCRYLTRSGNSHAKAGNINNALRHVAALDDPPDFISILDADFVPTRPFLKRTLALFHASDVGIVQTPQHFINPDPIQANLKLSDAWPDEQRYFFDILLPAKDAWGTAFCCGTSSVIRMSALIAAGGFPTESVTEDYMLTLKLKRFGFRTVYLNEKLSFGLAPEGLKEYVTQRSRWCLGFAQILRSDSGPFSRRNGMQFIDRVSLVESMLYWSGAYLFRVAGLLVPILYLMFDVRALDVDVGSAIVNFLPYYLAQVIVMSWLSEQRILPIMTDVSQVLSAREILSAFVLGLLYPKNRKFKVTAKGGDRSKTVVQWRMLGVFGSILALTLASILFAFYRNGSMGGSSAVALYWSWYNIVILAVAMAICVERPRLRKSERVAASIPVTIGFDGHSRQYRTADMSLGGLRLIGTAPGPSGSPVVIDLDSVQLKGRIVRVSQGDFAVQMEANMGSQVTMLRQIYSGRWSNSIEGIRSTFVARRLLRRMME